MTPNRPLVLLIAFALMVGWIRAASFSPANWPADERVALERLEERNTPDACRVVEGGNGLVAGTMSPTSVRVGIDVLKQGGNAADAATAVALTQVARSLGSYVSYKADAKALMTAPPLIMGKGTRKVEFLIPERGYNAEFLARLRAAGATFEIVPKMVTWIRDPEVFGVIDPETGRRYSVEISDLPAFSSAY